MKHHSQCVRKAPCNRPQPVRSPQPPALMEVSLPAAEGNKAGVTGPLGHAEPPGAPQCLSIPQTGSREADQDCKLKTKPSCCSDTSEWWPPGSGFLWMLIPNVSFSRTIFPGDASQGHMNSQAGLAARG